MRPIPDTPGQAPWSQPSAERRRNNRRKAPPAGGAFRLPSTPGRQSPIRLLLRSHAGASAGRSCAAPRLAAGATSSPVVACGRRTWIPDTVDRRAGRRDHRRETAGRDALMRQRSRMSPEWHRVSCWVLCPTRAGSRRPASLLKTGFDRVKIRSTELWREERVPWWRVAHRPSRSCSWSLPQVSLRRRPATARRQHPWFGASWCWLGKR